MTGFLLVAGLLWATDAKAETVQQRLAQDVSSGRPIVAHIVVALCDNDHQGIVPVPRSLGNGQSPRTNLYWGATYGVRTFFSKRPHWKVVMQDTGTRKEVLERIVLRGSVERTEGVADLYLVAEAWDGREIAAAIQRFVEIAAGEHPETLNLTQGDRVLSLSIGGSAHIVAYVGHNGLMDTSIGRIPVARDGVKPRSSIVLACASRPYFLPILTQGGSDPLLLTTGLMAPEAYTLDAALQAWAAGAEDREVQEAAAAAYNLYQKCGLSAARRLFGDAQQ